MAERINRDWPWPKNVGDLGIYPEEIRALQKRVEKNPDASPIPEAEPANFLSPQGTSEKLRVGDPTFVSDTQETAPAILAHVAFRRYLMRTRRRLYRAFDESIETEELGDLPQTRREQMRAMRERESAMRKVVERYTDFAESVYLLLQSGQKG